MNRMACPTFFPHLPLYPSAHHPPASQCPYSCHQSPAYSHQPSSALSCHPSILAPLPRSFSPSFPPRSKQLSTCLSFNLCTHPSNRSTKRYLLSIFFMWGQAEVIGMKGLRQPGAYNWVGTQPGHKHPDLRQTLKRAQSWICKAREIAFCLGIGEDRQGLEAGVRVGLGMNYPGMQRSQSGCGEEYAQRL